MLSDGKLRLPKIGDVRIKWSRDLPSVPSSVTLIKDRSGRYWVSFVVDTDPADDVLPPVDGDQGIDLGLTRFAVLADGMHIASPKYLRRAEKKLKKRQRELSRKKRRASATGTRPGSRSHALTLPWRMRAATSIISELPQRRQSRVTTAWTIDVSRFGLQRA